MRPAEGRHLFSRVFSALTLLVAAAFSLTSARATELISNGGFESGSTGWIFSGTPYPAQVSPLTLSGQTHSGTYFLWLGGAVSVSDAAYQTITIPSSATIATLSFYWNLNSNEGITTAYDTFSATVRDSSGNFLATVVNLSNINQTAPGNPNYHLVTFSLLPYAGQTIRIHFASASNASNVTNFRVDDVSVSVTTVTCSYSLSSYSASPGSGASSSSFSMY